MPRLWPESTIAIFAGGPSLTLEDTLKCRPLRTIAINNAYRMAPWADCLYAADRKWWDYYSDAQNFAGLKVSITKRNNPEIHAVGVAGREGLSEDPKMLMTGGNGGYQAMNLAFHLGARNILLLGYDMRFVDNKAHWHEEHPPRLTPSVVNTFRKSFLPHFKAMAAAMKEKGICVYNCTPGSALNDFPKMGIYEAIDRIHHRPYALRRRKT